ncbi:hypothetical protein GGU11DRAFT_759250 [Lentinula aff. detonsa]|uniref:Protein kinase domain-containing protein n=1 Tax=Lentinula aff. detonsa TaxID=2804958 RepID=A0AA38KDY0_9AGAR|nr:hypothetical protein GGU10DRAFT_410469 [Lentinula aff. detonsa]KAJ3794329.1 hypothetical protein GGU11DRAFT_759250 [Lentinula aff. detonsa]
MCTASSSTLFRLLLFVSILLAAITHAAPSSLSLSYDKAMKKELLGTTKERNPPWILEFYGDYAYLDEEDRTAFTKILDLDTQDIGDPIDGNRGRNNDGVAKLKKDYSNYTKDEVVVKVLQEPIGDRYIGEVKALKAVGLYVDSGIAPVRPGGEEAAVIMMKKLNGVPIKETIQYKHAGPELREKWLGDAKPMIRKQVVNWAVTKGILHADFHRNNLLFGGTRKATEIALNLPISEVEVLDFGYPGILKVDKDVTEQQVESWFDLQWEACMSGYDVINKKEAKIKKKEGKVQ